MPPRKKVAVEEASPETTPTVKLKKFYAPWCSTCTELSPEIDRLRQLKPGWNIEDVNTDDNPNIATLTGVKVLPTIAIQHDDGTTDMITGFHSAESIIRWVERK